MALGGIGTFTQDDYDNDFKVSLLGSRTGYKVTFRVSPDLIENRNVNYKSLDPIHMPGNIPIYQNTSARVFNVSNIKIITRNSYEASGNLDLLNVLKTWTLPHFGEESDPDIAFGAPPEVVYLSAYAKSSTSGNIRKIPCVVTQLSIPYPSDVDYIPTNDGDPFPSLMTIDMSLMENHSPSDYAKFNLNDYRSGNLANF